MISMTPAEILDEWGQLSIQRVVAADWTVDEAKTGLVQLKRLQGMLNAVQAVLIGVVATETGRDTKASLARNLKMSSAEAAKAAALPMWSTGYLRPKRRWQTVESPQTNCTNSPPYKTTMRPRSYYATVPKTTTHLTSSPAASKNTESNPKDRPFETSNEHHAGCGSLTPITDALPSAVYFRPSKALNSKPPSTNTSTGTTGPSTPNTPKTRAIITKNHGPDHWPTRFMLSSRAGKPLATAISACLEAVPATPLEREEQPKCGKPRQSHLGRKRR